MTTETQTEKCTKCGQPFRDGEIILGQSWNGEGGFHAAECPAPEPVTAAADFSNPYLAMVAKITEVK
jgi:hypothetical protein